MAQSSRHTAREIALQSLYAAEIGEVDIWENFDGLVKEAGLIDKHADFARELIELVLKHSPDADTTITALAENWKIERIATIDRLILQMALTELDLRPDIPVKVAINEAIELSKTFSTEQSSAFINGILDRYRAQLEEKH